MVLGHVVERVSKNMDIVVKVKAEGRGRWGIVIVQVRHRLEISIVVRAVGRRREVLEISPRLISWAMGML